MAGKTTTVSSGAALVKAAKAAKGGDTILLAAGNYGDVSLSSLNPTGGNVTIRSAGTGSDAVFESLKLTRVSNFVIADVDVHHVLKPGERDSTAGTTVNLSTNVSFVGVDFTGSLNGNRNDDGNGLTVTNSSRVSVLDSTFREFNNAIGLSRSEDIIVAGNRISTVREGVNITQIDGGLFERNHVSDVRGDLSKGDHADAFQVHAGGAFTASSDLAFRSNVIMTGGDAQGIFINSEKGAKQGLLHTGIAVENNFIEGNFRNAISVTWADGVEISGNTIRDGGSGTVPGLLIGNVRNAVIEDNISPLLLTRSDSVINSNVRWSNNIDLYDATTKQGVALASVFAAPAARGDLDFGALEARVPGVGFRAVAQIGNLTGDTSSILAAYVPMLEGSFVHHF